VHHAARPAERGGGNPYFLDALVGHREATDGRAAAVNHDLVAGIDLVAEDPVGEVRIADEHGEMESRRGVVLGERVKALRHLEIALLALGAELAGGGADSIGGDVRELVAGARRGPHLEALLLFEGAQEELRGRERDARAREEGFDDVALRRLGLGDARARRLDGGAPARPGAHRRCLVGRRRLRARRRVLRRLRRR
jgi:hypothetical protein